MQWTFAHILWGSIGLLITLTIAASYMRFVVQHDYLVGYQVSCDPARESCFVECVDDACEEKNYYAHLTRSARTLMKLCGEDISNCSAAYECQSSTSDCAVTYCDPFNEQATCDAL
jgi:hypothetical protein